MQTIYKYPLAPRTVLDLPRHAQPLCVQTQDDTPMLWVLLDTLAPTITRTFYAVKTGEDILRSLGTYVGTFRVDGLVFHVFEESQS